MQYKKKPSFQILLKLDERVLDFVDTAQLEGADSGGLKTNVSDIIIIAGLALIGSEGYIDIKHVIHVKHFDTDANLSQP